MIVTAVLVLLLGVVVALGLLIGIYKEPAAVGTVTVIEWQPQVT
jgi:hypothetical protein